MKMVINVVLAHCFSVDDRISAYFVYYNWSLVTNNVSYITFGTRTQTTIY